MSLFTNVLVHLRIYVPIDLLLPSLLSSPLVLLSGALPALVRLLSIVPFPRCLCSCADVSFLVGVLECPATAPTCVPVDLSLCTLTRLPQMNAQILCLLCTRVQPLSYKSCFVLHLPFDCQRTSKVQGGPESWDSCLQVHTLKQATFKQISTRC